MTVATRGQRARQQGFESLTTVSAGRKVTRRTRRTAAQDASTMSLGDSVTPVDATSSRSRPGALVKDPIPRRGAPVGKAVSLADISSAHSSYEGAEDKEDEAVRSELQDSQESIATHYDDVKLQRRRIALLPDLSRAADELMAHLKTGEYQDEEFRWVLDARKRALEVFREAYHECDNAPFFKLTELKGQTRQRGDDTSAVNILAKANMVTALELIQHMQNASHGDHLHLLEALDASFPMLFVPPGRDRPSSLITLGIRTCHLIELLANQASNSDPREAIASVFCEETDDRNYARLFAHGPYRSLGGRQEEEEEDKELCSRRITEVFSYTRKNRKYASGLARLKEKYPLQEILDGVKQWILEEYPKLQEPGETSSPERGSLRLLHPEDDHRESTLDSSPESQEIVRIAQSQTAQSLFVNRLSVKELEAISQSISRSVAPRQDPPQDYPQHSSVELLMQPTLSAAAGKKKRAHVAVQDDEEANLSSGDSSDFEVDTRPSKRASTATARASVAAHKRHRVSDNRQKPSSTARASKSARRAPSSTAPADPVSLQIDLEALKHRKTSVSHHARAQDREAQNRRPWSAKDTATLIDLIRDIPNRPSVWSAMEREDKDKFETPRGQQAYRDKARNLKVDFLMVDAPLPPGFDWVCLGEKERMKLIKMGKNPYRKVEDIDEDGRPTHTVYCE